MPHQAPLQPGDPRRVGRYRLAGRITGIPADGPIYLGTGSDGTEVMISMLRSDWTQNGAARDRFAAEAAAAKRVPPFCAARILDAGVDAAGAYLISEYVPGKSLLEVISTEGVLDQGALEAVAIGMATGLASVHQAGLVHGSFGPEFVILTAAGPRVVEFGITPPYGSATPSADMVAWAQTVVFAATGYPPTVMTDLDVLPYYIRDLAAACLNPDPSERPTARAAVLELIGDHAPPAGVLAEGSRRAVPGGSLSRRQSPQSGDGAQRSGAAQPLVPGPAVAQTPSRQTGPRPVSRHSRADDAAHQSRPAGQHPDRHGAHQQSPRRRRAVPLIAGAAVVCVLVVIGLIHLLGGKSTPRPGSGQSPNSRQLGDRSPLATQSAAPTVTAPAEFAGHWSGQLFQPPNDTISVSLTLAQNTGTVSYSSAGAGTCFATLGVTSVAGKTMTLSQDAVQAASCAAGTVTMQLTPTGTVDYTFHGGSNQPTVTGTVKRS